MPDAVVYSTACPLFVPLVENGRINKGDIVIETVAKEYLLPLKEKDIDTLILGCTHYPLLSDIISDILGPSVTLVSPGAVTAEFVAKRLFENNLLADSKQSGQYRYYVSDSTDGFASVASLFLKADVQGVVSQVSLDNF